MTDDRIKHGVGDHGDHDRHADPGRRQADNLIVIDHQQGIEAVVLDSERNGADPVDQFRGPRDPLLPDGFSLPHDGP